MINSLLTTNSEKGAAILYLYVVFADNKLSPLIISFLVVMWPPFFWDWLSRGTAHALDSSSCLQLLLGRSGVESKFVQQILNTATIHTIWIIWLERNQRNFHNKTQSMFTLFNHVLAEVKLSFNLYMVNCNSSMHDYHIARLFNIPFRSKRLHYVRSIAWKPPAGDTVKFNCDGSVIGPHPCGAVGLVIRNSHFHFLGAMVSNIGHASSIKAEFYACLIAMEKAQHIHLSNICLETDSLSVVSAFHKDVGVP